MKKFLDEEKKILNEEKKILDEEKKIFDEEKKILDEEKKIFDEEKNVLDEEKRILDEENFFENHLESFPDCRIGCPKKTQKSKFWNATYPSGFHRLDEPPEKNSAL